MPVCLSIRLRRVQCSAPLPPGPLERKAVAIANIARVLAPEATLFGATVLGRSARHTRAGRAILAAFNRRGVFDNLDDTEGGIADILRTSFREVSIETVGGLAIFTATGSRVATAPTEPAE